MEIYQAAYVAIAVFAIPGFVVAWILTKLPWAVAVSIPVSFGVYGLAGWFYGITPYAYDVTSVAVSVGIFVRAGLHLADEFSHRTQASGAKTRTESQV